MRFSDFKIVEAQRKQKNADQVKGKEPMPKAKPGRTEHPFQGRLVGESKLEGDAVFAKLIKQQFPFGAGYKLSAGMTHEMWYKELKLANRWLAAVIKAGELQPPLSIGNDFTIRNKGGMDIGIPGQMTPDGKPVAISPNDKAKTDAILAKIRSRQVVGESQLNEAEARIQHAEDIIFWEGSKGAVRAIESLKSLEQGKHTDVTIKWDGSPAIIFGRDENGEFILTDKSGFTAKGYDGKSKSADDLEQMFLNRSGGKNRDNPGYVAFAANMKDIFDEYERATPKDYRGFFKGDLLYYNTPEIEDGRYHFTPNIVTYDVTVDSPIGKQIGASKTGIVIHREVDANGVEGPLKNGNIFQGNEVLVLPPVVAQSAPEIDDTDIKNLQAMVSKNANQIDDILARRPGLSDLPQIFYTYLNSKVDTGIKDLAQGFGPWLSQSKVSKPKQQKIIEIINNNVEGFNAMWNIVFGIMTVKDNIINQLESQDADIKASIGSKGPAAPDTHGEGGEGYVLAHPEGDIKLVPRAYFTRANRSVQR